MTDATLSTEIILNDAQFRAAAQRATKQAQQLEKSTQKTTQATQENNQALLDSAKAIKAAAESAGFLINKNGILQKANGQFAKSSELAAQGLRNLTKEETALLSQMEQLQTQTQQTTQHLKGLSRLKINIKLPNLNLSHLINQNTQINQLGANMGKVLGAGIAGGFVAGTAAATGFFVYVKNQAQEAKQILQDSMRLGIDTTSFQVWTSTAEKFGVSADKAGDSLTDVNDKLGDFFLTGGGEAKDIFEQLKLNAEDYINLAPDEALIKLYKAAEKLNHQDKAFLFESIADDASLMIGALENGGKALKDFREQAVKRGTILSETELKRLESFHQQFGKLSSFISGFGKHIAANFAQPFEKSMELLNDYIDRMGGADKVALQMSKSIVGAVTWLVRGMADAYKLTQDIKLSWLDIKEAWLVSTGKGDDVEAFTELAKQRLETNRAVAQAKQRADQIASSIERFMNENMKHLADEMANAQKTGYTASRPKTGSDSYNNFVKKAQEKNSETDKDIAEKQREAAKKQEEAGRLQEEAARLMSQYASDIAHSRYAPDSQEAKDIQLKIKELNEKKSEADRDKQKIADEIAKLKDGYIKIGNQTIQAIEKNNQVKQQDYSFSKSVEEFNAKFGASTQKLNESVQKQANNLAQQATENAKQITSTNQLTQSINQLNANLNHNKLNEHAPKTVQNLSSDKIPTPQNPTVNVVFSGSADVHIKTSISALAKEVAKDPDLMRIIKKEVEKGFSGGIFSLAKSLL